MTLAVREQVLGAGFTFTLRAVSLSVTVLPVTTDGSIDFTAPSDGNAGNASLEDAVPRSILDSKATASLLDMEHMEKLSRGDVITDAGPQRPAPC